MKGVSLVSGGLDSVLMALILQEQSHDQVPVFIDYGQLAAARELESCRRNLSELALPDPIIMNLSGFGHVLKSGITSHKKRIFEDAFLPGRNLLFLLAGAAVAIDTGGLFVSIGLLSEKFAIFPDQREVFLNSAERTLTLAFGKEIKVLVPLFDFSKVDAIIMARSKGLNLNKVYSCHAGTADPCGSCVSCKERNMAMYYLEKLQKGVE